MSMISRAGNNKIRNRKPSDYRELMPDGENLQMVLRSAVATDTLFNDDYEAFRAERAEMLADLARVLID